MNPALDEIEKPSLKSGKKLSMKSYLCREHAIQRGYLTEDARQRYICIEEHIKQQQLKKEISHPLIKDHQQKHLDNYI